MGRRRPLAAAAGAGAGVDIQRRIVELDRRIQRLGGYIDAHEAELTPREYRDLLNLYGQLLSRLGRLMSQHQAARDDDASDLAAAIDAALDHLAHEWDVDL